MVTRFSLFHTRNPYFISLRGNRENSKSLGDLQVLIVKLGQKLFAGVFESRIYAHTLQDNIMIHFKHEKC